MGERRRRLTLGRLMLVIGMTALAFAMTRVDAAPGVSLCVFAACTWFLASRRFAEAMARRAAEGLKTSRAQRARILAGSASIAVVAIGLPDAAFLAGYYGYMKLIREIPRPLYSGNPYLDLWHVLAGAFFGIIIALYVASIVRRWLGPIVEQETGIRRGPGSRTHSFPPGA